MTLLAQQYQSKDELIRVVLRSFRDAGPGSPAGLFLLAGLGVGMGLAWWAWRRLQSRARLASRRALLQTLGTPLGLSRSDRRLLLCLGRWAQLEPALALVSPHLLTELVNRGQMQGLRLSAPQSARLARIRQKVAAAAQP